MYKLDVDRQKLLGHLSIISTEEVVLNGIEIGETDAMHS